MAVVTWLHLVALTFWLGGIFVNAAVLEPSMGAISPAERGKFMGAFIKRFAPLAWGSVVVVVITGFILADRMGGFVTLVGSGTRYGNLMLIKHILAAVLIANGAYLSLVLGRKMASFAAPPAAAAETGSGKENQPAGPPPELLRLQKRMSAMSWVQVVLALAILFVMGLL